MYNCNFGFTTTIRQGVSWDTQRTHPTLTQESLTSACWDVEHGTQITKPRLFALKIKDTDTDSSDSDMEIKELVLLYYYY